MRPVTQETEGTIALCAPDEDQACSVETFDLPEAQTGCQPDPACRGCGCTTLEPCVDPQTFEPCRWIEPDLCSTCARALGLIEEIDHGLLFELDESFFETVEG